MGKISLGWTLPNGPGSVERRAEFVADVERGLERISGYFEAVWMADHSDYGDVDMMDDLTGLDLLCSEVLPAVNAGGTNS